MPWKYILAVSAAVISLSVFWVLILRTYLLRLYYERQGIVFVKDCHAVIGAELQVSKLRKRNKSHDWLYIEQSKDLVGTIRGFSVQLYATSAEVCEKVV